MSTSQGITCLTLVGLSVLVVFLLNFSGRFRNIIAGLKKTRKGIKKVAEAMKDGLVEIGYYYPECWKLPPEIRYYNAWEHSGRGNLITTPDENNRIHGFLSDGTVSFRTPEDQDKYLDAGYGKPVPPRGRPVTGDIIRYDAPSGNIRLYIVTEHEHKHDPHDMFFAKVEPYGYAEERGRCPKCHQVGRLEFIGWANLDEDGIPVATKTESNEGFSYEYGCHMCEARFSTIISHKQREGMRQSAKRRIPNEKGVLA